MSTKIPYHKCDSNLPVITKSPRDPSRGIPAEYIIGSGNRTSETEVDVKFHSNEL